MSHIKAKEITKPQVSHRLISSHMRTKVTANAIKSYEFKTQYKNLEEVLKLFLRVRYALETRHTVQCVNKCYVAICDRKLKCIYAYNVTRWKQRSLIQNNRSEIHP